MNKRLLPYLFLALLTISFSCKQQNVTPKNSKIWLHKANTIEKARHFQYDYPGLEIDVHYDDVLHTYLIKHDADDTTMLPIDTWCQSLDNISNLGLWFDFKNLNDDNRDDALKCLKDLRDRYHLKGKLYVESHAYNELKVFRNAGFLTSYYIPYFNPYTNDSVNSHLFRQKIQDAIDCGVDAISGYEFQYVFMKTEFPCQTKLIWCVSEDKDYVNRAINIIGRDSLVDVLLLPNNTINR